MISSDFVCIFLTKDKKDVSTPTCRPALKILDWYDEAGFMVTAKK